MIKGDMALSHCKDDAERIVIRSVIDKINLTLKKGVSTHTPFLNPEQRTIIEALVEQVSAEIEVQEYGLVEDSEYAVLRFVSKGDSGSSDCPVSVIKLTYPKQFAELAHRDVLGTLMSFGLKREMIGDIRTLPGEAYIAVTRELCTHVTERLTRVKNVGVTAVEVEFGAVPDVTHEFKTMTVNLASLRLDSLVAAVTRISRDKAQSLVSSQKVKLNYGVCEDRSKQIKDGDLISIRGYGRYCLGEILGESKKNRLRVNVRF